MVNYFFLNYWFGLIWFWVVLLVPVTHCVTTNDTGAGIVYRLNVLQDVTLETEAKNFNFLQYLVVGKHPGFPNRRSLLHFENLPFNCPHYKIKWAKMYLYFDHAHKMRYMTHEFKNVSEILRKLDVHMVKSAWDESQATSLYRFRGAPWCSQILLSLNVCDVEPNAQSNDVSLFPITPCGFCRIWHHYCSGIPNYGVMVRATNEMTQGRDVRFFSKSYSDNLKHAFVNVFCI